MHRFFCTPIPPLASTVQLCPQESRHLVTVLRGRTGETITLMDGVGRVALAEVTTVRKGRQAAVECRVLECTECPPPSRPITLYIAPPRGKIMSGIVRQATELGVATIIPVLTEFGVSRPDAESTDGWRQDAREAMKQSGNPFLTEIKSPILLSEALSPPIIRGYVGAVPEPDMSVPSPRRVDTDGPVSIWIGAEGGFSPQEFDALQVAGLQQLVVGRHILRVETAVVACISWVLTQQIEPE